MIKEYELFIFSSFLHPVIPKPEQILNVKEFNESLCAAVDKSDTVVHSPAVQHRDSNELIRLEFSVS